MAKSRIARKKAFWKRVVHMVVPKPLLKFTRLCVNAAQLLLDSTFVLSLPIFLYLSLSTIDFLVLTTFLSSSEHLFFTEAGGRLADASRDASNALKVQFGKYIYIFAFLLGLVHWKTLYGYARDRFHWVLLLLWLLLGALISYEPIKVVTNTILIYIGLHMAILFAKAVGNRYHIFYSVVLYVLFLLHLGSLFIFFTYNNDLNDFLSSGARYGGLAGNPNALGASAVMGCWAAFSLLSSSGVGLIKRILAIFTIPIFILHLMMSGSATSVVTVSVIAIVFIWFRFLSLFSPYARMKINICGAVFAVLVALSVFVVSSPAELYQSLISSLGKDATMTGRTDTWAVARDAISQKPLFGWSFDSHQSVKSIRSYDINFNHYHNGFLDTLIAGGLVLLLLVLYNMGAFTSNFFKAFKQDRTIYPIFLPFVILVFLNLSEYSLLRPNSYIWNIYVIAFVLLTLSPAQATRAIIASDIPHSYHTGHRRKRKKMRWA